MNASIDTAFLNHHRAPTRLKFCADISLGKTVQGTQRTDNEKFVNYVRAASIQSYGLELDDQRMWMSDPELDKYDLRKDDVLIVEGGAGYGRSVVLDQDMPGWGFQNHVIRVRPHSGSDGRFLNYCVKGQVAAGLIDVLVGGATIPALSSEKARELPVPEVSLARQRHIADYLDRETGEIDAMIGKLDPLVEKFEEHRRAVSANILAELFNGENVPLWSVLTPIKDQNHPHEEVLSVYRDYGVIPKSSRDDNYNRTPADVSAYQLVRPADVVINKMKAWQGSLGVSGHQGIVSPDYQVARPIVELVPAYLHAVLRSPILVHHYRVRSRGVRPAQWRLYWEDFANLRIPLPPIDEQRRIADDLDEGTQKIDAMLGKAAMLKEVLIERRAALITDVVTGKKEVV